MASLKRRARSLLRSSLRFSSEAERDDEKKFGPSSPSNLEPGISEKLSPEEYAIDQRPSVSSAEKVASPPDDLAVLEDIQSQRLVRTIPTWAHVLDKDGDQFNSSSHSLPLIPPDVQVACHNNSPSGKQKNKADPPRPPRGKLFDSQREWFTPAPRAPFSEDAPKWRDFARSSTFPPRDEDGEIVTEEWLIQNGGDYSRPWLATSENGDIDSDMAHFLKIRTQRKVWWKRMQRTVLHSPGIPLVFRTIVWCFSLVALVLGSSIRKISRKSAEARLLINSASPNMAIIVDAIALVYIFYITYDEYTGKPLGLRSAKAKMRLIFLDLFFIVFDSANLSLAFGAVSGSDETLSHGVRQQQSALASVLLIALVAWLLTFSISVLRLIERVAGP